MFPHFVEQLWLGQAVCPSHQGFPAHQQSGHCQGLWWSKPSHPCLPHLRSTSPCWPHLITPSSKRLLPLPGNTSFLGSQAPTLKVKDPELFYQDVKKLILDALILLNTWPQPPWTEFNKTVGRKMLIKEQRCRLPFTSLCIGCQGSTFLMQLPSSKLQRLLRETRTGFDVASGMLVAPLPDGDQCPRGGIE